VSNALARIRRRLASARARQVVLALGGATSLGAGAVLLGWSLATLAANEGARSVGIAALLAGAGAAIGLVAWRAQPLHRFASDRAQARRFEAVSPELDGALLTVLDRSARPRGSAALLEQVAVEVARTMDAVPPARAWPAAPARRDLRWLLAGLLALAFVAWLLPIGPVDALQSLLAAPRASPSPQAVAADGPRVMLGDITLRYLYPTYTRLDPVEVPNTNGEVHAPRGTVVEVRARTADEHEAASFVAYEAVPVPVELVEGRGLKASFTVADEGAWRFLFPAGPSADHRIVPEPDLPPDVALGLPPRLVLMADDTIEVRFAARDDFGVAKVVVEVVAGGVADERVLRTLIDVPRSVEDAPTISVADLGLAAGTKARLRVGALDNDEVSGAKMGWSSPIELTVTGASGSAARNRELMERLLAALLPVLADGLVDPSPLASDGLGAGRLAEQFDQRYTAFDGAFASMEDLAESTLPARLAADVSKSRRAFVAFARGLSDGKLSSSDVARLALLHASAVEKLEEAVYLLDRLQRIAALGELMRLVRQLAMEAQELDQELPQLNRQQAMARLDQLSRLYDEVKARAGALERGGVKDFLEQRGTELEAAMTMARKAIATGDDHTARAEMARVARLLEEMAGGVEEAMKRGSGQDGKMQEAMSKLGEQLESLAEEQAALREQTGRARDQHGSSLEEGMKSWERVDRAVAEAQRQLDDPSLDGAEGRSRNLDSALRDAEHDARSLGDSARARDQATAEGRAQELERTLARARSRVQAEQRSGNLSPEEAAAAQRALAAAQAAAQQASSELAKLGKAQSAASPELTRALRDLSSRQRDIAERAGQAARRAEELGQQMPTGGDAVSEAAAEAASQAGRATERMEQGDAMGTEGAQQAAEDALRRASEALQQAEQDMQEMAQAGQGGEGEEPGGGAASQGDETGASGRRGGANGQGARQIAIPAPEEFETPEAYRKALLEGMQGEVPEAYRAAHRRYYEELVRQ